MYDEIPSPSQPTKTLKGCGLKIKTTIETTKEVKVKWNFVLNLESFMYLDLKTKTARVINRTVLANSPLALSSIKRPLKVLDPNPHRLNSNIMVLVEMENANLISRISPNSLLKRRTDLTRYKVKIAGLFNSSIIKYIVFSPQR